MKTKKIVGIVGLIILGLVSCQKEESETIEIKQKEKEKPTIDTEPSEAVKEYFGYQAPITKVLESSSSYGNAMSTKSTKMEKLEEECFELESTQDEIFYDINITLLACSGLEGRTKISMNKITHFTNYTTNICSLSDNASFKCYSSYVEHDGSKLRGPLSRKLQYLRIYHSKPDLNIVYDYMYNFDDVTFTITVAGEKQLKSLIIPTAKLSGSLLISMGDITYNSNVKTKIKYAYLGKAFDEEPTIFDGPSILSGATAFNKRRYCETILTEGVEVVKYKRNGIEGTFLIDYGQGEIDTKATITENGETYEIDYKKLREDIVLQID